MLGEKEKTEGQHKNGEGKSPNRHGNAVNQPSIHSRCRQLSVVLIRGFTPHPIVNSMQNMLKVSLRVVVSFVMTMMLEGQQENQQAAASCLTVQWISQSKAGNWGVGIQEPSLANVLEMEPDKERTRISVVWGKQQDANYSFVLVDRHIDTLLDKNKVKDYWDSYNVQFVWAKKSSCTINVKLLLFAGTPATRFIPIPQGMVLQQIPWGQLQDVIFYFMSITARYIDPFLERNQVEVEWDSSKFHLGLAKRDRLSMFSCSFLLGLWQDIFKSQNARCCRSFPGGRSRK